MRTALILTMMAAVVLLAACSGAPATPRLSGTPQFLAGKIGKMSDLTPTQDEIAMAREKLGDGFVGLLSCTESTEFHSTVVEAAKARAAELNIKFETFNSDAKAEKQPPAIKNFVDKGAKVLIVCVLDPNLVKPALDEAMQKGVWIIEYAGSNLNTNGITVGVGDQNTALGCAAGEITGELIATEKGGQANVAILDYPDLPQIVVRADNIVKCLLQKAPQAKIVGRFLGGTTENGLKSMSEAMAQHPEIDVVASINDAGAYGALTALQAAGKDPKTTIIVGIDAEAKARDLIKAGGFYRGSVDTAPAKTGQAVVNGAVKLLAGATVAKQIEGEISKVTADTLK